VGKLQAAAQVVASGEQALPVTNVQALALTNADKTPLVQTSRVPVVFPVAASVMSATLPV
jgi:hypothetical protein